MALVSGIIGRILVIKTTMHSALYLTDGNAEVMAPSINMARNNANEDHMPETDTMVKVANGRLRTFAFMPRSQLGEYLGILLRVSGKLPHSYFILNYVGDYDKRILE